MRQSVQDFAKMLLDHSRTSQELEIMLNYNSDVGADVWEPGDHQSLDRLKLAIKYKQKQFVAHPSVQQLLASIWYEGEYIVNRTFLYIYFVCVCFGVLKMKMRKKKSSNKSLHHSLQQQMPN